MLCDMQIQALCDEGTVGVPGSVLVLGVSLPFLAVLSRFLKLAVCCADVELSVRYYMLFGSSFASSLQICFQNVF